MVMVMVMVVMMMMMIVTVIMIMCLMMIFVSVEQRPGWTEDVKRKKNIKLEIKCLMVLGMTIMGK